jgi:uncharacterized protein (TIGR03435 family)
MSAPPPFESLLPMLRTLLIDRFKLAVHTEEQPVQVWALVVGKHGPKLKEADPSSRSGCKRGAADSGSGSAAVPMLNYTCQNTTMKQLAEAMHSSVAPGYVDRPAVDMTGLQGAYDFTITWTPRGVTAGNGRPAGTGDPGQNPVAADPSGGITFFDAVEKQLGLRLEKGQKHPMPVLVIDRVEQLVPDN